MPATDASDPLFLHGGNLPQARLRFPHAPEPWLDLSTGLNPIPYPVPALPPAVWSRLPEPAATEHLEATARTAYGVAGAGEVVAVPGSQAAVSRMPDLLPGHDVRILGPTYGGHLAAWAAGGRSAREVQDAGALEGAAVAVLVNPNNPDGRLIAPGALRAIVGRVAARGGVTVVDEAFMDVMAPGSGLLPGVLPEGCVVLRSFGKAYGLAGLRLGFAVLDPARARRLRALLGSWPVSGPAITIGQAALADRNWLAGARARLIQTSQALDAALGRAGLAVVGGTPLFRLVSTPLALRLFEALGRAGILVRPFPATTRLRIGTPATPADLDRLLAALSCSPVKVS